jgi:amino acid adenylation domain-containing protein
MRLGKEHCRQDSVLDQPPASGLEPARAVSPYATKTSPAPTAPTGDLPAERFWRQALGDLAGPTPLIIDSRRHDTNRCKPARQHILLEPDLASRLADLSRRHDLPCEMIFHAAWAMLLHRYSGESQIIFGATPGLRDGDASGSTTPLIPICLTVDKERSVLDWLATAHGAWTSFHPFRQTPPERIRQWIGWPAEVPLFESAIQVDAPEPAQLQCPLHLTVRLAQTPSLIITFDPSRLDGPAAGRLLGHYRNLLAGMAEDPSRPLWQLPLLDPQERQQLLIDWNRTAQDYPNDTCIHQLFAQQAQKTPHATALVFEQQTLTYEQLNRRANQLAHHLIARGVGPDTLVGICCERSLEMVVGLLAILKAGGAYVPLDPNYPPERLAFMLQDAAVPILLTQRPLLEKLPPHQAQTLCLDADWATLDPYPTHDPDVPLSPDHLAYVIYTSGSTGRPKGVMIEHRGLTNYLTWCIHAYAVSEGNGAPVHSSLAFDLTVTSLYAPLLTGRTVILIAAGQEVDGLSAVLRETPSLSLVKITPVHLKLLGEHVREDEAIGRVRAFVIGGEALYPEHVAFWRNCAAGSRLINEYGPTETVVGCCIYEILASQPMPETIPIGRPIANTQLYILDPHLQPVPVGVPGELFIGGHGLARGYLNRPELTKEKFLPNPFDPHTRLYRTGDLARYLPDGNIEFLGRLDHQVKLRGFRIELGEIEAVLAQHPAVRQAVVLLREDTPGDKRLVAYLVPSDTPPTPDELRQHLKQKLPDYMVPSAFVLLDALPLSPNGKIDRKALPAPDTSRAKADAAAIPTDQLELQLLQIWEQVLNVRPIGTHDNFFDLGGHSLLAVRLFAAIEHHCTRKLPLALLFQHPTIAQLAGVLRNDGWSHPDSTLVPIQPGGSRPPLFCVPGAGGHVFSFYSLTRRLGLDQPVYGLQLPGADGRGIELKNVEDVAAHNIREIRAIQPHGPYYLGGYSLGGMIVFEMARQFRAMGEQVALLALFDSWGPGYPKILPPPRRFLLHLKVLLSLNWREQFTYLGQRLRNLLRRFHRTTPNVVDRSIAGTPLARTIRHAARTYHQAWRRYVPRTYPGRLVLFNSVVKPDWFGATFDDPTMGWGKLAALGVDVRPIPGAHLDIFKDASLQVLADELRNCLQAAVNDQTPPTGEASA